MHTRLPSIALYEDKLNGLDSDLLMSLYKLLGDGHPTLPLSCLVPSIVVWLEN